MILQISSKKQVNWYKNKFPSNKSTAVTIMIVTVLTFIVRIFYPIDAYWHVFQLGQFVPYILLFYLGTVAFNNNWFEHLSRLKPWTYAAIGSIIALPIMMVGSMIIFGDDNITPFLGGFGWQSLLFSAWNTIACYSIILSLLYIYNKRFNSQGKLSKWASSNYYGAYIFHTVAIVSVVVLLKNIALPSVAKALIVALLAIPISFGFTAMIRMIHLVRRMI